MTIGFVTTNKGKFEEAAKILVSYGVSLEQVDEEYVENHDDSIEQIAESGAREMAERLERPVVVEDTGLFFEAYDNFPGALPKFVYATLGFKGIMKLLEGEKRGAYFKTVLAFAEPGKEPMLFDGIMRGQITEEYPAERNLGPLPYDFIFIPEGKSVTTSALTLEEKNSFSQRGEVFRKFGEYIGELI